MEENNLNLNKIFEKEAQVVEVKKNKQRVQKYIKWLTFEQLLRLTERKNRELNKLT